ncbi:MAG: UvrD-helicase domain-containing protein [Oscillospiraceae bacterium]|jgi:DNA helicase-2/ATP-dependent DNA helicase PcrA|nr:UvrD-helicase domain-containing protein [Oscillospiraceae bacterium]
MTEIEFNKRFVAARRRVIARDFKHLNDMQRDAVMATEGPLLLLAGAGSGKTTVLINRIVNLLKYGRASDSDELPNGVTAAELDLLESDASAMSDEERRRVAVIAGLDPVEPWRIIAITFTNKAADELKSRLEKQLGTRARDIWAMTFHSACVRILRRNIELLGYDRSFTIYDTTDSNALMRRIIRELGLDEKTFPSKSVLGYVSRAKDAMMNPDEFREDAIKRHDVHKRQIAELYDAYEKRMKSSNALDFDDLILLTVRLLQRHEEVREYYQDKFKYVLIDEYQDTNNLQYMLASLLTGKRGNICVVGDDDQSIYKFRGATIENILSFEKKYKNARVIRLEQNYRSLSHILDAAHSVVRNNTTRHDKKLWTEREAGDPLVLHVSADERDEAKFVADTIFSSVTDGRKWSDHAVLYRMNAQSNQLEYAFKRAGIPYRVYGGTGFFERAEVKDMLAYLSVIHNPDDDTRLTRIINTPTRGIGQTTIERVTELASSEGASMFDVILRSEYYPDLQKSAGRLHAFADIIEDLRYRAQTESLGDLYDAVLDKSGYIKALEAKETDENLTRIENARELKTNIVSYVKENPEGTLGEFLSEMALYTDMDKFNADTEQVVMMTIHSAKGLEFDTVFIVGAENGIFPSSRSIGEPADMEEERRLCYVAMTRAKRRLYFTCAERRTLFGKTAGATASRFVDEIDAEHIVKEKPKNPYADVRPRGEWEHYNAPGRAAPPPRRPSVPLAPPAQKSAAPKFKVGDRVTHKAFGDGVIREVKPTGGDALLEVEFDNAGKKRLMQNSAAAYMTVKN